MFVFVIILGFAGFSLLYKSLQLPFSYEFLYLLLQVLTIFCVVAVILLEMAIFLFVMHVG